MVEQGLWSTTRNVFPTLSESTDHSINSGKQLSSWCTHLGKCQHVRSGLYHYNDVIMGAMASKITSLTMVYSTVYSGADQRKHQSSASLAFVREFTGDRWIPRSNGQWRGKCFHVMTSSCYYTWWYFDGLWNRQSRWWMININRHRTAVHIKIYPIEYAHVFVVPWLVVFSSRVLWRPYNLFIHMP